MVEHQHCKDLLASFSDYIDGNMEADLCAELERHLQECDNCTVVVNTLRKTIELYREDSISSEIPLDVRSRLFYRLDLQDFLEKPTQ